MPRFSVGGEHLLWAHEHNSFRLCALESEPPAWEAVGEG
jgi:hypothetical protein